MRLEYGSYFDIPACKLPVFYRPLACPSTPLCYIGRDRVASRSFAAVPSTGKQPICLLARIASATINNLEACRSTPNKALLKLLAGYHRDDASFSEGSNSLALIVYKVGKGDHLGSADLCQYSVCRLQQVKRLWLLSVRRSHAPTSS